MVGSGPLIRLSVMVNFCIVFHRALQEDGNDPPIRGILELFAIPLSEKVWMFVHVDRSDDNVPQRSLKSRINRCNSVRSARLAGNVPKRLLDERSIHITLSWFHIFIQVTPYHVQISVSASRFVLINRFCPSVLS